MSLTQESTRHRVAAVCTAHPHKDEGRRAGKDSQGSAYVRSSRETLSIGRIVRTFVFSALAHVFLQKRNLHALERPVNMSTKPLILFLENYTNGGEEPAASM